MYLQVLPTANKSALFVVKFYSNEEKSIMKKSMKTMSGVTLLEIMLVLAIAAMVIVLSIKYYKSANASSQANAIMSTLQAITAAAENLSQGTGDYLGVTQESVQAALGLTSLLSPWNTEIKITTGTTTSFGVSVASTPDAVCALIAPKFAASANTASSKCSGGSLTYTYSSTTASVTPSS
jgi:type II secretory pathway pseudopilin PulG